MMPAGYIRVLVVMQTAVLMTSLDPNNSVPKSPLFHSESSSRLIYNFTNLVYQYYLTCGQEYICDSTHFAFIKPYQAINSSIELCPRCHCDKGCVQRRDCCPDVLFAFPESECIATSVFPFDKSGNHMITTCHDQSSSELKTKCEMNYTHAELIQTPPVTSTKYAHTFRNKFCAECNGVYEYDIWTIDISCFLFTDFNFLSSYDEIVNLAMERSCSMTFKTGIEDSKHDCVITDIPDNDHTPPTMCNLTGTRENFDQDIETACMSNYYEFSNIFCNLCNPPESEPGLISTCNASGLWSPHDSSLEDSCARLSYSMNSVPYKNVFCFLCNRNNTFPYPYYDARIELQSDNFIARKINLYSIKVQSYNMDFYHTVLKEYKIAQVLQNEKLSHERPWNTTKLMMYHYAFYGHQSYCDSDFASKFLFEHSFCDCDSSCLFRSRPPFCCVDFVLDGPTSCFSSLLSGDKYIPTFYGAVDKCSRVTTDDKIRQRCEDSSEDIFGVLPVTYENTIYKNFDCLLCNIAPTSLEQRPSFTWNLYLDCVSDLNIRYRVKVYDIITAAKYKGCSVTVQADDDLDPMIQMSEMYCTANHLIKACNVSGLWSVFDQDILMACENWGPFLPQYKNYKNLFCFICNNPVILSENGTSEECAVPEENQYYGRSVMKACGLFPAVPGIEGYKNIFCDVCSNINKTISYPIEWIPRLSSGSRGTMGMTGGTSGLDILPPMRDLFLPKSRVEMQIIEVNTSDDEIYDSVNNKVRNLTCYPGKLFVESKCKPLLKVTNNLRYTLAFVLEGDSISHSTILTDITAYMMDKLMNILGTVIFDSFHAQMNVSCGHEYHIYTLNDSVGVRVLLHTTFLVESDVDRFVVEEKLLNMTDMEYNIVNRTYRSKMAPDAFALPSVINSLSFVKQCYIIDINGKSIHSYAINRPAIVSKLLLCRQVVFSKNEFTIDEHNLEISVLHSSRNFHQGEFLLIDDTARICIEDFKEIYSSNETQGESHQQSEINKALSITTLICTIISLICLCLTFITYCLFRVMRSIPGINNMNLVFVMFFAQLLFQFGFTRTSVHNSCVAMGIFIHFFWLASFACMNVCSFHMYSVFAVDMMAGRLSHRWKRQILTYMLYSHGIPALIVILNIIVASSTSQDGDVGYGYTRCFINKTVSFYLTFLAPILIICISNIYFFIRTAIQLKSTPKIESTKEQKNQFVIYVKLFSLTGITWILLVLDTLFPVTVFSFLVTIATACQGLFVFVSFVLNKRVINYYTALCWKKKYGTTRSSSTQKSSLGNTQQSSMVTSSSV